MLFRGMVARLKVLASLEYWDRPEAGRHFDREKREQRAGS